MLLMILDVSKNEVLFYFIDGLKLWVKTEMQSRGVHDLSLAIIVAKSLIEFECTKFPKPMRQGSGQFEGSSFSSEDEADGKPTHCKGKIEIAAKDKGKEKKP